MDTMTNEELRRDRFPDAPDGAGEPEFLTPAMARKAREQRERGFVWTLRYTGGKALVRPLSLGEKAVIGTLPQLIQTKVLQALADISTGKSALKNSGTVDVGQALDNLRRYEDAYNAVAVAGFLNPRLILSESQRTSPDEVLVSDLHYLDREAFFHLCNGSEEEMKRLDPFLDPGRPATVRAAASLDAGGLRGEPRDPGVGPSGDAEGRL